MSGLLSPFGRPKWARRRTIAPLSASPVTVGRVARRRVSSVTTRSDIGTLRSTRTRALFPLTSPRSSRVLNDVITSLSSSQPRHRGGGVDHPVREAPLIVVPGEHPDELALEDRGLEAVDGRAGGAVVVVDRDQRLLAI